MRPGWVCLAATMLAVGACTLDRSGTLQLGAGGGGEAPATTTSTGGGCAVEACPGYGEICTQVECFLDGTCSAPAPAPGESCALGDRPGLCSPNEAGLCLVDLGSDCVEGGDCQSGHCVDGVCCNSACSGTCLGCAGGTCGPLVAGSSDESCDVCDGLGNCVTGAPLWASKYGKSGDQALASVAAKSDGELGLGGVFAGTTDFDGTDVAATSTDSVALAFAADGTLKHPARYLVGPDVDVIESVTHDHLGRIVVCGWFKNNIVLGGASVPAANGEDAFVVAIDPVTGEHVWWHRFGGQGNDQCMGVAHDPVNDAIVVTGWFSGANVAFGSHILSTAGNKDVFVARIDDKGAVSWATRGQGAGDQEAHDVAIDGQGNAIVTGRFKTAIDFGKGAVPAAGGTWSGFVTKLLVGGSESWTRSVGHTSGDTWLRGAAATTDRIVVVGETNAPLDLDGTPLSPTAYDALVLTLDAAGAHVWHDSYGNAGDQAFRKIAVDPSGHLVLIGDGKGTTTVAGIELNATNRQPLLVKIDPTGIPLWGTSFGGSADAFGLDVAVDGSGRIYAVGSFSGTLTIGTVLSTSATNAADAWIASFAP
jgi:hypothetical protein